jgi:hypothetical protein
MIRFWEAQKLNPLIPISKTPCCKKNKTPIVIKCAGHTEGLPITKKKKKSKSKQCSNNNSIGDAPNDTDDDEVAGSY